MNKDTSQPLPHKWTRRFYTFSRIYLWVTALAAMFWAAFAAYMELWYNPQGDYCEYIQRGAEGAHIVVNGLPCRMQLYLPIVMLGAFFTVCGLVQVPAWVLFFWTKVRLARLEGRRSFLCAKKIRACAHRVLRAYLVVSSMPIIVWGGSETISRFTGRGGDCGDMVNVPWYYIRHAQSCYGPGITALEIILIFGVLILLIQGWAWMILGLMKKWAHS